MTDREELSKRVAELYGIDYWSDKYSSYNLRSTVWLHDDNARCFELMIEHELHVEVWSDMVEVTDFSGESMEGNTEAEVFGWHDNDKAQATRIAILKCLVKIKE